MTFGSRLLASAALLSLVSLVSNQAHAGLLGAGRTVQAVTGTFQGNSHLGLQLLSNNEIRVDVTGDLPNLNDQLILDLSFTAVPPPPPPGVPEPATLALLGSACIGLAVVRRRRKG